MFNKKYLGLILMAAGGIGGALIITMFSITRGERAVLIFLLAAAVGCVVVGSILIFTRILDRAVQPVVAEIDADLKDDLEDIKAMRATNVQLMVIATLAAALIFFYYVLKLHKLEATWSGVPVIIPAGIVVVVGTLIVLATSWFRNQELPTPLWVFFIPTIGIALALILGLQTENRQSFSSVVSGNAVEQVVYNDVTPMVVGNLDPFSFLSGSGSSASCDDDSCLFLVLIIALVIITLVMVVGAATIPHFWLMSGMVFLTILTIITVHEIRIRRTAKEAEEEAETNRWIKKLRKSAEEAPEGEFGTNKENQDG